MLLSSLGFEGARARAALEACDGDVERAANLLLQGGGGDDDDDAVVAAGDQGRVEALARLVFERDVAAQALRACDGSAELAAEMLLEHGDGGVPTAEENGPHTSPYLSFYGRLYGGNTCNVKT